MTGGLFTFCQVLDVMYSDAMNVNARLCASIEYTKLRFMCLALFFYLRQGIMNETMCGKLNKKWYRIRYNYHCLIVHELYYMSLEA